ncbi:hypothetical protein JMJ35_000391 [Cladonia borealis]|uniref:Uncharacterized protein n=1 Tax=Cladonia borealis TaxID=184061 RepID=A0AA39RB96_9LECA|nr:hypothetical protein JMJ35_000391 [Cladonia borealis]
MPQPLFYLGPEDVLDDHSADESLDGSVDDLAGDDSEDADLQTGVSSTTEAEPGSQEESMTEAIHSSVTDMMSTCGYLHPQFRVPPPSPASSSPTSSNGSDSVDAARGCNGALSFESLSRAMKVAPISVEAGICRLRVP